MRYQFLQDVHVAGALHVVTVRSQRASAALAGIDAPQMPAGAVFLTAADIPGSGDLEFQGRRVPILARDVVRYVGEPVALVAAGNLAAAQSLASDTEVRYAELPEASAEAAGGEAEAGEELRETLEIGDQVVEPRLEEPLASGELVTLPRRFAPPTPHSALALWDGQILLVRAATQHPFHLRATVAAVLDLPPSRVRVVAERVDGPGGKLLMPSVIAAHAALVAFRAGAAARVRYSWREELSVAFRIPGTRGNWKCTQMTEGSRLSAWMDLVVEGGAYDVARGEVVRRASRALVGPYRWERLSASVGYVAGESAPCGLPPGCGELEATCLRELCVTSIALGTGMDPAAWRLDHLDEGQTSGASGRGSGPDLRRVLEEAVRVSGFSRKHAANEAIRQRRPPADGPPLPMRGVGIALATFRAGFGAEAERGTRVRLTMGRDRRVTLATSLAETGRGGPQMLARIVAKELGVPAGSILVAPVDTSSVPSSGPAAASRTAALLAPLVRRCCGALRSRLKREQPPCSAESASRGGDDGEGPVSGAATVVAVVVDRATRAVRCSGIWTVIDAGEILDPEQARRVAFAALVRGMGIGLTEESEAATVPVPPAASAHAMPLPRYRVAGLEEVGELEVAFLDRSGDRPKVPPAGISELALLGVPPALAAAVAQATGIAVRQLPIVIEDSFAGRGAAG